MVGRMDGAILPTIKGVQSRFQIHPPQVMEARVVAEVVGFTVQYGSLLYNYKPDLI